MIAYERQIVYKGNYYLLLLLLWLLYRPQFEYNVQINSNYKYDTKFLNSSIVFAFISSSGRVFYSLIEDGKNEYL